MLRYCALLALLALTAPHAVAEPADSAEDLRRLLGPRLTPIAAIQGAGHVSPLAGSTVLTLGVVTGRDRKGFWLQDPDPDDSQATSEALYVYQRQPQAKVGDLALVRGRVAEWQPRGAHKALPITELAAERVSVHAVDLALPEPVAVGPGAYEPPTRVVDDDTRGRVNVGAEAGVFDPQNDGLDFWESLEGMRVRLLAPSVVSGTTQYGEFGVVAGQPPLGGRYTDRGGILLRPTDPNPEVILVDDALAEAPVLTTGDRFDGDITGLIHYAWGAFKLLRQGELPPVVPGKLQAEVAQLAGNAEHLTIATYNVENLHPEATTADGTPRVPLVARVIAETLGAPDIVALQEIQDGSGPEDDGTVSADATIAALLQSMPEGLAYEYIEVAPEDGADGGQPGGNIRCGYLYRPDRVQFTPRGEPGPTEGQLEAVRSHGRHVALATARWLRGAPEA